MTKAGFIVQCIAIVLGNTQGKERVDILPKAEQHCEQESLKHTFVNPNSPEQMAQENIKNATEAATMLGVGWGIWKAFESLIKE